MLAELVACPTCWPAHAVAGWCYCHRRSYPAKQRPAKQRPVIHTLESMKGCGGTGVRRHTTCHILHPCILPSTSTSDSTLPCLEQFM
jgi:hypothetical protein